MGAPERVDASRSTQRLCVAASPGVGLYAGTPGPKPFASLESRNVALLELGLTRSVLLWGAVNSKVSHVMGGPSCKNFSVLRHREGGPLPVRGPMDLYGLPELSASNRQVVDRDTAWFIRQVWLHAVATAGRKATPPPGVTRLEVGFLLEQPMLVDRYLPSSHALFGEVPNSGILDFGIPMPTKLDCLKSISTRGFQVFDRKADHARNQLITLI